MQTQCTYLHEYIIVQSRNSSVFTRLSFINRTMSQPFPNKLPPTVFLIRFVLVAFSARALSIYLNSVCVENIRYASDDLVENRVSNLNFQPGLNICVPPEGPSEYACALRKGSLKGVRTNPLSAQVDHHLGMPPGHQQLGPQEVLHPRSHRRAWAAVLGCLLPLSSLLRDPTSAFP